MNDNSAPLHIVMLPWLAMGHLLPFLELSKRLARRGHRISYLTTPSNIQKLLPNIPPSISSLLHLIELRMPADNPLPASIENTSDLPTDDSVASSTLSTTPSNHSSPPSWPTPNLTGLSTTLPLPVLLQLPQIPAVFPAPSSASSTPPQSASLAAIRAKLPDWVPFPSTIAYRPYEARELFSHMVKSELAKSRPTQPDTAFMMIRTCNEFEQKWLQLQTKMSKRPVIPVGLLPPSAGPDGEIWASPLASWLDTKEAGSVVYVAFGSEVKLTTEQIREVAAGLELSGLPFVWALRTSPLPDGFKGQTASRGIVCRDWVEQIRILGHNSVGGFLTHGGWNSIVEGLSFVVAMVILPFVFDQGLNARNLSEKGIGVEVDRDNEDGTFTGQEIAKNLRKVMVEQE